MYYIYRIAYQITDDIKAKKEAEKPFWWDQLHPEAKDMSIEEIEKVMIEGGAPAEKIKEMSKHEKYMAFSEGCHTVDCMELEKKVAELESEQKQLINAAAKGPTHGTDFLNVIPAGTPIIPSNPELIPGGDDKLGGLPGIPSDPIKKNEPDDEHIRLMASHIKEEDLMEKNPSPFSNPVSGQKIPANTGELRKYAQSIVKNAVTQINVKADEIPDGVSVLKEDDLLSAVIEELQNIKGK